MKINNGSQSTLAVLAASLAFCAVLSASGASILKLDDTNVLTDPLSWTNGVAK